jgi:glycyl-tRNA synthetase beta chain
MTSQPDLLLELGTEELPPKSLQQLSEALGSHLIKGLAEAELCGSECVPQVYASPRRLAVMVPGVATRQADRIIERRGPALAAAIDAEGNPTRAAQGFAESCGVAVDQLDHIKTDKGEWLAFRSEQRGQPASELIPDIVSEALRRLPIPKRMRWSDLDAEFVRPVHWLLMMHGGDVIPAQILSVQASNQTHGHRFHRPGQLQIDKPADYTYMLEHHGHVIADFELRRERIWEQITALGAEQGGQTVIDNDLLNEVTALVEWPVALQGRFDTGYLEVPPEALISAMQDHQKYFPVVDTGGNMLPRFIFVSNIESSHPDNVINGNERVLNARFSDARFYWDSDRKVPLDHHIERLKSVVFHNKLGSVHDRMQRVRSLASRVARLMGTDIDTAERAATLAKADLLTGMVYEFPDLQGTMGRYYALHQNEKREVADAIREQYLPRHAGDALPASATGRVLSIADKIDSLVGIFSIGEIPTGDKDPFALRRASLGVLRIMIEDFVDLDLRELLGHAAALYELDEADAEAVTQQVFDYMLDRLQAYYSEHGYSSQQINSVLQRKPERPVDFDARLSAVAAFAELPEAEALAAANKRISNILRKSGQSVGMHVETTLLIVDAEKSLYDQIENLGSTVEPMFKRGDYTNALTRLAALRPAVDRFFDDVMVMDEDEQLRNNRLALLNRLAKLFLRTADLSVLQ